MYVEVGHGIFRLKKLQTFSAVEMLNPQKSEHFCCVLLNSGVITR